MKINIHATVSDNSLRYFDYVCENYKGLAEDASRLRFFTYCLDTRAHRVLSADRRVEQSIAMEYGRGSTGHAKSVDAAIANLVAGEINVISDTDIAIVKQDWDRIVTKLLLGEDGVGIIGVPYEGLDGFSSGSEKHQTYKNQPTTTWMAVSPQHDFSGLSVMPDKDNVIEITTEELSAIYQLPVGFTVLKDVGWQIPGFLHDHEIPYLTLDIIKPASAAAKVLKGCSPYHDEFQLAGEPFIVHQRGSMKHRFRIDPLSAGFYDACDAYLGNPAWAVFPTVSDRLRAATQDAVNLAKRPLRALRDIARSR